jgi:hypothetical protein
MNDEIERIWKEVAVAWAENHKRSYVQRVFFYGKSAAESADGDICPLYTVQSAVYPEL